MKFDYESLKSYVPNLFGMSERSFSKKHQGKLFLVGGSVNSKPRAGLEATNETRFKTITAVGAELSQLLQSEEEISLDQGSWVYCFEFPSPRAKLGIGRAAHSDRVQILIPLQHSAGISKLHASLRQERDTHYLRDCDSTYGTWVNGGRKLKGEEKELRDGSLIDLATVIKLMFCSPGKFYEVTREALGLNEPHKRLYNL